MYRQFCSVVQHLGLHFKFSWQGALLIVHGLTSLSSDYAVIVIPLFSAVSYP